MSSGPALGAPVGGGPQWVNFVNGRLLRGEDLAREQSSGASARSLLAQAIGYGIASGLTITDATASKPDPNASTAGADATAPPLPKIAVSAGVAINRLGQMLQLTDDQQLPLTSSSPPPKTTAATAAFARCESDAPAPPTAVLTGSGVYVVVMGPASTPSGSAQLSGQTNADPGIVVDYVVENVDFRLATATSAQLGGALSDATRARNAVAYMFLGSTDPQRTAFDDDPSGSAPAAYGLLDTMIAGGTISAAEVPLAVISWDAQDGFQFIDAWSVRRRLVRPGVDGAFGPVTGARAPAEGEAAFLQFQDQISGPGGEAALAAPARKAFGFLPSAGVVPLSSVTSATGFFSQMTTSGPFFMNAARVEELLRASYTYPPIDTASGEMVWLYEICENARRPTTASQPVVLFTSGHLQYRANAQFDLAYFDYANFAVNAI
jgi:hypothetical protein